MPFNIEPLTSNHIVEGFDCGEDSVNRYLLHFAMQNNALNLSRVFVAVERGETQVRGFYTLSSAQVEFKKVPGEKKYWPQYPVPFTLIGQLGADQSTRGQRLGEILLLNALEGALHGSRIVASHGVIVDALHERVRGFYMRYGFEPLQGIRLFRTMQDIEVDFRPRT